MAKDLIDIASPIGSASTANKLTELQKAIVDTLLEDRSLTAPMIADKLGCDKTAVYKSLRKQHVREYLLSIVSVDLILSAPVAMATQRSLLSSKSDYIRHQAASDLLNRNEIGSAGVVIGQAVQVKIDLS